MERALSADAALVAVADLFAASPPVQRIDRAGRLTQVRPRRSRTAQRHDTVLVTGLILAVLGLGAGGVALVLGAIVPAAVAIATVVSAGCLIATELIGRRGAQVDRASERPMVEN
jgi:hypothetical protein